MEAGLHKRKETIPIPVCRHVCVLYVFVDFFQCHSRFYEALGLCASLTLVVPLAQLDWCATLSFWLALAFFRLDFGLPLSRFRYLLPRFSSGDFDYILCKLNELEYAKSRWKDNLQLSDIFRHSCRLCRRLLPSGTLCHFIGILWKR